MLEIPFYSNDIKNLLYSFALKDHCFLAMLSRYSYPNIKKCELIFLHNNTDKLLIENFVPNYALRLSAFANSEVYFD